MCGLSSDSHLCWPLERTHVCVCVVWSASWLLGDFTFRQKVSLDDWHTANRVGYKRERRIALQMHRISFLPLESRCRIIIKEFLNNTLVGVKIHTNTQFEQITKSAPFARPYINSARRLLALNRRRKSKPFRQQSGASSHFHLKSRCVYTESAACTQ